MSKKLFNEIKVLFDKARVEALDAVAEDSDPDEIYEMVLQLFPVSQMSGGKK